MQQQEMFSKTFLCAERNRKKQRLAEFDRQGRGCGEQPFESSRQ